MYALMILQICRRFGRPTALEIFRCPDHDAVVVDQLSHRELRTLWRTNSHGDIDSLFDQVHYSISQPQID